MGILKAIQSAIVDSCGMVTDTIGAIRPLVNSLTHATSTVEVHAAEMHNQAIFDTRKAATEREAIMVAYQAELDAMTKPS